MKKNKSNNKQGVEKVVEDLAARVLSELDLELVGIEYKSNRGRDHLVVYIDKPGGVYLEDCELVSRSLSELLDREDPIPCSYTLEVSSPGVERPLMKKEDFDRFKGHHVRIKTYTKINGQKKFTGVLKGLQNDSIVLHTDEGETINLSLKDIAKANLFLK
ncbi:MAG TPA: ribosome maturation factor RimP [Firmicutes bacterium]|jgi:ribosome maturation factor RimP|nr:ribosome maturation factor RimP [Bacillota bacterium]